MALLEHEAQRFAEALDGYEDLSIVDIGGTDQTGFWIVAHDHRFGVGFEVSSQLDYWDRPRSVPSACELAGGKRPGGVVIPGLVSR